jgi:hypothetical protein
MRPLGYIACGLAILLNACYQLWQLTRTVTCGAGLAAAAGLAGVAWEARSALLLDAEQTMADAERLGLFLWSREPDQG